MLHVQGEHVCRLLGLKHDSSERGKGDLQGLRVTVTCDGFGVDGAEIVQHKEHASASKMPGRSYEISFCENG